MNYISDILYWISTGLAGACYCVADYSFWSFAVAHRQFFRTVYVDSKNRIAVAR